MPSAASERLAKEFRTYIRPVADGWQACGQELRVVRQMTDAFAMRGLPRGAKVWNARYGSIRGQWVAARNANAGNGVLLQLHGGGFVIGSHRSHRNWAYLLSWQTGRPVFLPHYRRAPEHPFPAAADDCLAAYRLLIDRGLAPARIGLVGDAAGAHLAVSVLADLAAVRLPMPGRVLLYSPWLDLECTEVDARDAQCPDPVLSPSSLRQCRRAYLGLADANHPRLRVLDADMSSWPPVLIQVGGTELLLGDAQRLAASLVLAGVPCDLQVWPGQVHGFAAFVGLIPEATEALRSAGAWFRAG
ncbi:alpha/beta hydrolase [Labedaea rhizosphaerae]|uniref:Acetyl esterase/lipase n=1 Tax=Labedaea rhizosphaerae TaxID=598644 RepID=A0A4R6SN54_LABRH|nr:alpha/beta hydrolase [Labedaea rhizosphaerae]TDQ05341.1 acetyl esterase/lipase [Labedaea rhizosphaerae]